MIKPQSKKRNWLSSVICLVLILVLLLLPTGYESAGASRTDDSDRISARIVSVDDSTIKDTGLVRTGEQVCDVRLLEGVHKGEIHRAYNMLNGSLEQDKIYKAGETALVLVSFDESGDAVASVSMIDHYRITGELLLLGAFFRPTDLVCRLDGAAGRVVLRPLRAFDLEGSRAALPQGCEPDLGRITDYGRAYDPDHRTGVRV